MTTHMVRNGNILVRKDQSYGTKWLWYEMSIITPPGHLELLFLSENRLPGIEVLTEQTRKFRLFTDLIL